MTILAPPKPRRKSNRPPGSRPDPYRLPVAQAREAIAQGMTWQDAARLFRIPRSLWGRL